MPILRCTFWLLVLAWLDLSFSPLSSARDPDKQTLTIWMMPNEPRSKELVKDVNIELEKLEQTYKMQNVDVLNATDKTLSQNMRSLNREFAADEFATISGQRGTLDALASFAESRKVTVRVRFLRWESAFETLSRGLIEPSSTDKRPDVCQIGTTWRGYFVSKGLVFKPTADTISSLEPNLKWWPIEQPKSLPYLIDVRLLFYWADNDHDLDASSDEWTTSWERIRDRLNSDVPSGARRTTRPPLAFPLLRSPDLIHNYAPLVWAGRGAFLPENSTRFDLSSPEALAIPLLIHEANSGSQRPFSFPDSSQAEVRNEFRQRHYSAMFAQTRTLYDLYELTKEDLRTNEDLPSLNELRLGLPPAVFKGGSDLIVTSVQEESQIAFELASFLVSDIEYSKHLAQIGALSAQLEDNGIDAFLAAIPKIPEQKDLQRDRFKQVIQASIDKGLEYPPLATWAQDVESQEVLEGFQQLWRRIAEFPHVPERVKADAKRAELTINSRTHTPTWLRTKAKNNAVPFLLIAGISVITVLCWKYRAEQELRHNRFLVAAGIYAADAAHPGSTNLDCYNFHESATYPIKSKAHIIHSLLWHWQYALGTDVWKRAPVEVIVWRAILSAVESRKRAGLLLKYKSFPREKMSYKQAVIAWFNRLFLKRDEVTFIKSLLREHIGLHDEKPLPSNPDVFSCVVEGDTRHFVDSPVMLEMVLTYLIQNAMRDDDDRLRSVTVSVTKSTVCVTSMGSSMPDKLMALVNDATNEIASRRKSSDPTPIGVFYERLLEHWRINDPMCAETKWPGLGITLAFCIAAHALGGMEYETSQKSDSSRQCITKAIVYLNNKRRVRT